MFILTEMSGMVATMVCRAAATALIAGSSFAAWGQNLPPEVQVGTADIMDHEFDWGRNGVNCPTCNFGAGNSRFAYIDNDNILWVGYVDFSSGDFFPRNGKAVRIDTNATSAREIGNGPEWMLSERGSELMYNRWTDGLPKRAENMILGFARMGNGSWVAGTVDGSQAQVLPVGSLDATDPIPSVHYQTYPKFGGGGRMFWRDVLPDSTGRRIPIISDDPAMTRRWVPGSRDIIITAPASPDAAGVVYKQVFLFHTETGALDQLTFDPLDKLWAFMWKAPEYNNENLFFVVVGGTHLNVYRNLPRKNGAARWRVINSIAMPTATPYVSSPEPFVHNGRSWIFFSLAAIPDLHDFSATSLIAMTGIAPGSSAVKMLTSDSTPPRARRDPEYFITANGPYLYYNRYIPATNSRPQINEGIFRVDTGLGPRTQ